MRKMVCEEEHLIFHYYKAVYSVCVYVCVSVCVHEITKQYITWGIK